MLDLVELDDPIVQAHYAYLHFAEATTAAVQAEKDAKARFVQRVEDAQWIEPETLWYLYWLTDAPAKALAGYLKIRVGQVGDALQPGLKRECACCHEDAPMPNRQAIRADRWECTECVLHRRQETEARSVRYLQEAADRRERLQVLAAMPYQEYLQTSEWQETRQVMYKRAGYRCQVCSEKSRLLDVHHNTYENRGNEDLKDLVVLCRSCHARHHGKPT